MGQHEMMRAELLLLHPEQGMYEGPAPKVAENPTNGSATEDDPLSPDSISFKAYMARQQLAIICKCSPAVAARCVRTSAGRWRQISWQPQRDK